jgi:hypothetical protein
MPIKKFFLVQCIIEADVTEWPEFDERRAEDHFRSALHLSGEDKVHRINAYLLARKPDDRDDLTLEEYEDRGLKVEICQDAHTVGTDVPSYFSLVWNPKAKQPIGSIAANHCTTVEAAKEATQIYVDKRLERERKKAARELEKSS